MANKRIRNYDDGSANVTASDVIGVDRAGLDELEKVTLAQAVTASGVVATAISTHEAAADPHPTYLTAAEGAAAYQPLDADLTAIAAANNGSVLAATTASFLTADETKLDALPAAASIITTSSNPSALAPDAPVVVADATDTLAVGDHGHVNRYTNASQVTVTIPTDAVTDLVDGFWCVLFAEGAGGITLSTSGITLAGSSPVTTVSQNGSLLVQKTAAADTWIVSGSDAPLPPAVVAGSTDTLALSYNARIVRYTNAGLVTVTIPTDATLDLPDGFEVALFAEGALGLTLSTTGVTLAGASVKKTIAQNEVIVCKKTTAANTWLVLGATAT